MYSTRAFPFVPFLPGRQLKMESSPAKVELAVLLKSRAKEALRSRGQRSLPEFFLMPLLNVFFGQKIPEVMKTGWMRDGNLLKHGFIQFYSFFVQRSLKPTVESMCTLLCRTRPQSRQERRPKLAASRSYQKIHVSPRREVDALLMLSCI